MLTDLQRCVYTAVASFYNNAICLGPLPTPNVGTGSGDRLVPVATDLGPIFFICFSKFVMLYI